MIDRPLTAADVQEEGYSSATWEDRARVDQRYSALRVLPYPCRDCAVACGLYKILAWSLAEQPPDVRDVVLPRWWCHNAANRACRGAANVAAAFDFRRAARAWLTRSMSTQPHPPG